MLFRRFGLVVAIIALLGLAISAIIQPSRGVSSGFTVEQRLELLKAKLQSDPCRFVEHDADTTACPESPA